MLLTLLACTPEFERVDCDDAEHHCLQGNMFDSIGRGLDGVELCVDELPDVPCVVTGSDGSFQLPGLPTTGQFTLLSDREGYEPLVNPFQAERLPVTQWASYMVTDGVSNVQRDSFPVPVEEGLGFVIVDLGRLSSDAPILWDHVEGGTLGVESEGDSTVMYLNGLYLPDEDLESTASGGFVAIANVPVGELAVRAYSPEGECDANLQGWDFEVGDPAVAPIQANRTTYFALECPG